ncbi:MAG: hypothetical protein JOZ33_03710 [Acidobacteriaceae bacterium]|nr:hypothetical protein [Acidobacteriaceae bacterium]
MKLRIKSDSLRIRVGRSELERFLREGRIEDTIHFGAAPEARLTYALEASPVEAAQTQVRYSPQEVAVVLTPGQIRQWNQKEEVGVYTQVPLAPGSALEVVVEKDFACLDRDDEDNKDTFANPHTTACQAG